MSKFINGDCMDGMAEYADNHFDLAITDPPYGIGAHKGIGKRKNEKVFTTYLKKEWDINIPDLEYFEQLFRISKNYIIWGANYFPLSECKCFIVWDKMIGDNDFAMAELAYTNFKTPAKIFKHYSGANRNAQGNNKFTTRIHPTQKPVELYRWLLKNYAKKGDLILDTHVGSASSLIACEEMGFDYVGYEKDLDYYESATKRLKNHNDQIRMI